MLINIEGLDMEVSDWATPLAVGDEYIAKRNTDWKFLTVKWLGKSENKTYVPTDNWDEASVVFPVENAYPFDTHETRKVLKIYYD